MQGEPAPGAVDAVAAAAWRRLFAATASLAGFAQLAWVATWLVFWLAASARTQQPAAAVWLLGASLPVGLCAIYFGFRVRLDAELLALLEPDGPVAAADFAAGMDRFRAQLAGRAAILAGAPLAPRYAGVLRQWRRCTAAIGLQMALLLCATIWVIKINII
jgi:hypothetical protein